MNQTEDDRNPTQRRLDEEGLSGRPVDVGWKEDEMGDDRTEGKLKEAEGKLTGDEDREAEGKAQQAKGKAQDAAADAAGAAESKLRD